MNIPPIGQRVLRLKDGVWSLDHVAQVKIGDEKCVLVWGNHGSDDITYEVDGCFLVPKRQYERFPSGQDEWKRVYRNLEGVLLEF